MPLSDEKIMAHVDGELEPTEDAKVAAQLADDPIAGDRADALRKLNGMLRASYESALKEPVPDELLQVVDQRRARASGFRLGRLFEGFLAPGLAHAVTAVLLIAIGGATSIWLFGAEDDANGPERLAAVLETGRSGAPIAIDTNGGQITPLLTFVHRDGRYCRQFEDLSGGLTSYGVACRSGAGAWQLEMMVHTDLWGYPVEDQKGPEYQLATGPLDSFLDQALEAAMPEPPLAPEAESDLISGGWKEPID